MLAQSFALPIYLNNRLQTGSSAITEERERGENYFLERMCVELTYRGTKTENILKRVF